MNGGNPTTLRGDCAYLADLLSDGSWHSLDEIHAQSRQDRGHAFTIHSRASDLRKRHGFQIEQRSVRGDNGRTVSFYRLSPLDATNDDTVDPPVTMGLPPQSFVASSGPAPNPDASSLPGRTDAQITTAAIGDEAGLLTCDGQLCLDVAA